MQKIEKQIKSLAIYQIVGGIIGLMLSIYFAGKVGLLNVSLVKITILSFYLFSTYCGFLLLQKNYYKGLNLSIINQVLQIISFSVLGFTFEYT